MTLPGDAFQNAVGCRRRLHLPVADDEDIVGGALGDVPLVVQHDRFGHVGIRRLDLGQDVVEIVEALDPRRRERWDGCGSPRR